jgi:hypothetical protein
MAPPWISTAPVVGLVLLMVTVPSLSLVKVPEEKPVAPCSV